MGKRRNSTLKKLRKFHKWPGVIVAFLAVLFACSGIVLNHRSLVSSVDVSRSLLPSDYHYKNWNLAAVRGGFPLDSSDELIYGNMGVWKKSGANFQDFNPGFPNGIDHRKINKLLSFKNELFAATQFGLYKRSSQQTGWKKVTLPIGKERMIDLFLKQDTLIAMSRNYLLRSSDGSDFEVIQLPAAENYERKASLFQTLWQLHSGELVGFWGKLLVDLLGLITILLSISGLLHFFFPKLMKRRKKRGRSSSKLTAIRRLNLRGHNLIGYIFAIFLLINVAAGMFLRPPLLIPIASSKVGILPGTHLDNSNPWFDKLRRGVWNESMHAYLFSTSEGFYWADESLSKPLQKVAVQPPVSVMGCTVLEPTSETSYLVGSFSGLFSWDVRRNEVVDAFTGKAPQVTSGKPISDHLISGYINAGENDQYLFDYRLGMQPLNSADAWEMPNEIVQKTPMSLWNLALEIHTGRIFEHLIGPFYILYVPLSGLCLLVVLISGFLIWWRAYRKKKKLV